LPGIELLLSFEPAACIPQMCAWPGMRICGLTCGNVQFRGDGACH
jgi:hypothetical protein